MDAHSMIMTFRPMSQMLRLFVVPEIEKRVAAGTFSADQLPFKVHQFRFLQGDGQNLIEINDDVRIAATVPVTHAVKQGEPLTLADVNPDGCFLQPPTINGKPGRVLPVPLVVPELHHDVRLQTGAPPDPGGAPYEPRPMRYPLAEMVHAEQLARAMKPIEKYQ